MPVAETTEAFLFVSGVEVTAPEGIGGIVAFGDSLTDANISKLDTNNRWPDELARRLVTRGGRMLGVMNQGIGGNRILHDVRGDSGLRRFDRDVLAQTGLTHAIVLLGINDIRNRNQRAEEFVTADEMIAGLQQMAVRAHARGIRIFGGTLLTFENESFNPGFYTRRVKRSVKPSMPGSVTAAPSMPSSTSKQHCATPATRRGCCRSMIAATTCTRATQAICRWATSLISRSSTDRKSG